jgi:CheY-like chemotaxis protein
MTASRIIRQTERETKLPRIPIIALTGLASTAARNEAEEAGMDDYLTKPVSFNMLHQVLPGRLQRSSLGLLHTRNLTSNGRLPTPRSQSYPTGL